VTGETISQIAIQKRKVVWAQNSLLHFEAYLYTSPRCFSVIRLMSVPEKTAMKVDGILRTRPRFHYGAPVSYGTKQRESECETEFFSEPPDATADCMGVFFTTKILSTYIRAHESCHQAMLHASARTPSSSFASAQNEALTGSARAGRCAAAVRFANSNFQPWPPRDAKDAVVYLSSRTPVSRRL